MRLASGARPSIRAAQDRGTRSLLLALVLAAAIAGADAALGASPALIDLLVVPPVFAAAAAGPGRTAIVGGLCAALAVPLGLVGDPFLSTDHAVSIATVALGGVLAVWVSLLRESREKDSARLRIQYAAARVLSESESLEDAAPSLLETIGGPLGWEVGGLWRIQSSGLIRCIGFWSAPGVDAREFQRISSDLELRSGTGLPGRVLESGRPAWIPDVLSDQNFPRAPYAAQAGLRAALAFPIQAGGSVEAVIEFFARRIAQPDDELTRFMATIGTQVGEFIDARRAEEDLRVERGRAQQERERLLQLEQVARLGAMQAREQLEAILGGVADGVTAQAPDGRLVYANEAAVHALGYESAPELLTAPLDEFMDRVEVFDEEGNPFPVEQLPGRKALAGEAAETLVRFRARATGDEHWSLVKANPVVDSDGDVVMAINVMEDITEHKRSELREQFLSESSRVLAASLDRDRTLEQVARLAVPDIADRCRVDLVAGDGSIQRVAQAQGDSAGTALADARQADRPDERDVARVLKTGRSELYSEIPSVMIVPLRARDHSVGALTFVSGPSARRFDEHDLALAEELARRCANAIENARLFGERDYIAQTLQRSLLPAELPHIPGLETAARFLPASGGQDVGGDFYDLFQTRDTGWTVVVGDVCGKGPDAAAVTALARYTLRAAAMREKVPSRILAVLNEALLRQRDDRRFCTVSYAQIDVHESGVRVGSTSGGHPLPLVLRANGDVEQLGKPGTLLGVVEHPHLTDTGATLGPGDALVFYTDGVTEAGAGSRNGQFGEERLAELVASCAGRSAETIAARIEAAALDAQAGNARDDIAVVTVRVSDSSPEG